MKEVAISEFKAKCLGMLEQVRKTRKPIRITRFGKPVAEIVPSTPRKKPPKLVGLHGGERSGLLETSLAHRQLRRLGSSRE